MAEIIRIYTPDEPEYKQLERACMILNATTKRNITYTVGVTWFDFGQNWSWTTILAHDPESYFGDYQALCPRDYELILKSEDLLSAIQEIKSDKDWRDK